MFTKVKSTSKYTLENSVTFLLASVDCEEVSLPWSRVRKQTTKIQVCFFNVGVNASQ